MRVATPSRNGIRSLSTILNSTPSYRQAFRFLMHVFGIVDSENLFS
jgi:hypothetical protein